MNRSYIWKMTLFFSLYLTTHLSGHPTALGKRYPVNARLARSVTYSSKNPFVRKQAPLVALVNKLNRKR